ncbi:MAG: peptidylprolyl isomerase [Clostridia bacterium]
MSRNMKKKNNRNMQNRNSSNKAAQKEKKAILYTVLAFVLAVAVLFGINEISKIRNANQVESATTETTTETTTDESEEVLEETKAFEVLYTNDDGREVTHTGVITVDGDKEMKFELFGNIAPITVENFVGLANENFYDGLIFHRVIEDFMIQGGDPLGTGSGGSDENIVGEFTQNNIANDISHERGIMSMARSSAMDSASSQFFIMHADGTYLDGSYAAFGEIIEGIEVVDEIAIVETDSSDKPTTDVVITSIVID